LILSNISFSQFLLFAGHGAASFASPVAVGGAGGNYGIHGRGGSGGGAVTITVEGTATIDGVVTFLLTLISPGVICIQISQDTSVQMVSRRLLGLGLAVEQQVCAYFKTDPTCEDCT
jgi:hypothetical protein